MRHIIAILLQNEAGALARVAGMFSSRGYNIDSLSVAPTHDPAVSRLTLVTTGSDEVIEQIIKQTRKLIDVVEITDLSRTDHIECELLILKIEASPAAAAVAERHRARLIDSSDGTQLLQLAGTSAQIDALVAEIRQSATIIELVRSGLAAIGRGQRSLTVPL